MSDVELAKKRAALLNEQNKTKLNPLWLYWLQVWASLIWIYDKFVEPVAIKMFRPIRYLYNKYRLLWQKLTYKNGKFSRSRGGLMIIGTFLFFWYVLGPMLDFVSDATLYSISLASGHRNEEVFLTGSQEITYMHDQNIHAIKGCHNMPCTGENSIYFRVQFSLFNLTWSIVHGDGWYWPEAISAAVPNQVSKCIITSYGLRLKWITRGMEIYPDMLAVECQPLGVK